MVLGAVELCLGWCGWRPTAQDEDPYVGFSQKIPLFVTKPGRAGNAQLSTAENKLRWFNRQTFSASKAPGTYRIFCLGGSTTYGHPYDDTTSFAGWLRELLPVMQPNIDWEVINCGGISYASYRAVNLMQEVLQYEPDLFIVYTGHNEFLEARTYGQLAKTPPIALWLGGLASRTRMFTAVSSLFQSVGVTARHPQKSVLSSEVKTLLDSSVGLETYHRDDAHRQKIVEHFKLNLLRMVDMARSQNAKIIFVTPASNIGQCSPFKSEDAAGLSGQALAEWKSAVEQARQLHEAGNSVAAIPFINRAVECNNRHADTLYLRAQILRSVGESQRAREDFLLARDEDVCTVRAPQEIIEAVRAVARERQVPLVDFVRWTELHSPDQITDDSLFLDHVHGTIEAYRELAILLLKEIADDEGLNTSEPTQEQLASVNASVMSDIDSAKHGIALRNVSKVFSWAGKRADADRLALRALELAPDDPDTIYQAGNAEVRSGRIDAGIAHYQRVLELAPNYGPVVHASLGFAYGSLGNEAACIEHYQRALQIDPSYADIHYNLANIFEQRGELDKAQEYYQNAIDNNPKHFQAQYRLGLVYSMRQDWQAAKAQYLAAEHINPVALEPHVGLGEVMWELGDYRSARQQIEWVLSRAPNHAAAKAVLQKMMAQPAQP